MKLKADKWLESTEPHSGWHEKYAKEYLKLVLREVVDKEALKVIGWKVVRLLKELEEENG